MFACSTRAGCASSFLSSKRSAQYLTNYNFSERKKKIVRLESRIIYTSNERLFKCALIP